MKNVAVLFVVSIYIIIVTPLVHAASAEGVVPTAILPFETKGQRLSGYGNKVSNILFAELATNPGIYLVDREEIDELFKETELNLTGMVNQQQAIQVGQLTGAKILVTGTVFELDDTLFIIAKIISTETSRIIAEKVKGKTSDNMVELVETLSTNVANSIINKSDKLIAKRITRKDRLQTMKNKLGNKERQTVLVEIHEKHMGRPTVDPAAETEMLLFLKEVGFVVLDANAANKKNADIIIKGEGFSEFAMRHGNIVSVKARLEIKAMTKEGKVLAVDRQMEVEVDIAEQIAGKKALQEAAAKIAERIIPILANKL